MKIVDYLIKGIEENKITKEEAIIKLENVRDNLLDYKETMKYLKRRIKNLEK